MFRKLTNKQIRQLSKSAERLSRQCKFNEQTALDIWDFTGCINDIIALSVGTEGLIDYCENGGLHHFYLSSNNQWDWNYAKWRREIIKRLPK